MKKGLQNYPHCNRLPVSIAIPNKQRALKRFASWSWFRCYVLRYTLLVLLVSGLAMIAPAQQLDWVKDLGGSKDTYPAAVATDAFGNVYTVGMFTGITDFDPGTAEFLLSTSDFDDLSQQGDIYISKLDANGNFVWAKQLGGAYYDEATTVKTDAAGNIYIAGKSNGQIDVDPGTGPADTFSLYGIRSFIVKLSSSGNLVWARQFADSTVVTALGMDAAANLYIAGNFTGTKDLNPGAGLNDTFSLTATTEQSCFIVKLNNNGSFIWAKNVAASAIYPTSEGIKPLPAIAVSDAGSIYVTGMLSSYPMLLPGSAAIADFDPGPGVYELTANALMEQYIYKLDADGNFIWAGKTSGPGATLYEFMLPHSIALDDDENVYTVGEFNTTFDVNPGTAASDTFYLHSDNVGRAYVFKWDSAGHFVWAHTVQHDGPSQFNDIAAGNHSIYISGVLYDSVDVDMGESSHWLYRAGPTGSGQTDAFLLRMNAIDGTFSWVAQHAADNGIRRGLLALDKDNNCYATGDFSNAATFDIFGNPTEMYPANPFSLSEAYVLKYSCNSYKTIDTAACQSFSFNDTEYTQSGTYEIVLNNAAGCDSIITLNLTLNSIDTLVTQVGNALVAQGTGVTYQWLDCNGMAPVEGATSQSFTPSAPGQYAVTLTSGECSYTTGCISFNPTGINGINASNTIKVYPNPAQDVLYIITARPFKDAALKITDISGRTIMQQQGLSGSDFSIDVNSFSSGIYLLDIAEGDTHFHFKWVKE